MGRDLRCPVGWWWFYDWAVALLYMVFRCNLVQSSFFQCGMVLRCLRVLVEFMQIIALFIVRVVHIESKMTMTSRTLCSIGSCS